ncbi:hypothetical protein HJG60_011509 [Phyllostomus discolor]|uniref:Uncharacterized protein n=1 Tax=Phyllostomus discolor TaxID=89673 RepID=A0A834E366_9CHIR|nr:hypothetical protein HJG60_011509 [Phyllostomus discolor]
MYWIVGTREAPCDDSCKLQIWCSGLVKDFGLENCSEQRTFSHFTSHAFSSQFCTISDLYTPQSWLAGSVGPLGSVLNVTSSRKPSLTTDHKCGLAALVLCSMASSKFLYLLSFNCLSHCSKLPVTFMRAQLVFIFVSTISAELGTVLDECLE